MSKALLLALALILPLTLPAEETTAQPPAEVEQQLRDRVDEFYALFRAARFRVAENMLTEESKEAFYVAQKRRIYGHTIKNIEWGDKFDYAQVFVTVEQIQPMLGSKPLPVPLVGSWRKVEDEWFLDIAKRKEEGCSMTPAGPMCFDRELGESGADLAAPVDVATLTSMVEVTQESFVLPSKTEEPYSVSATIKNRAKGMLTLEPVAASVPANVRYTADKVKIPQDGEATITITVDPTEEPVYGKHSLAFTVIPIFRRINFELEFTDRSEGLSPRRTDAVTAEQPAQPE